MTQQEDHTNDTVAHTPIHLVFTLCPDRLVMDGEMVGRVNLGSQARRSKTMHADAYEWQETCPMEENIENS